MRLSEEMKKMRRDAPMKGVILFAIFLVVFIAAVYGFTWGYISFHIDPANPRMAEQIEGQPTPERVAAGSGTIAGPQLQTDESEDLREFKKEQEHALATAPLPIEEAMKAIVERGLPTR